MSFSIAPLDQETERRTTELRRREPSTRFSPARSVPGVFARIPFDARMGATVTPATIPQPVFHPIGASSLREGISLIWQSGPRGIQRADLSIQHGGLR